MTAFDRNSLPLILAPFEHEAEMGMSTACPTRIMKCILGGAILLRGKPLGEYFCGPESAGLLSNLAVIDALLGQKQRAIDEAKRSVELLLISQNTASSPAR